MSEQSLLRTLIREANAQRDKEAQSRPVPKRTERSTWDGLNGPDGIAVMPEEYIDPDAR